MESAVAVGKWASIAAVPVALLFSHLRVQYRITELGYDISEETDRHEKLQDDHRKLRIEARVEGRSETVSREVRDRFGLEPVEPEQIITVETGGGKAQDGGEGEDESREQIEHARLEERKPGRR